MYKSTQEEILLLREAYNYLWSVSAKFREVMESGKKASAMITKESKQISIRISQIQVVWISYETASEKVQKCFADLVSLAEGFDKNSMFFIYDFIPALGINDPYKEEYYELVSLLGNYFTSTNGIQALLNGSYNIRNADLNGEWVIAPIPSKLSNSGIIFEKAVSAVYPMVSINNSTGILSDDSYVGVFHCKGSKWDIHDYKLREIKDVLHKEEMYDAIKKVVEIVCERYSQTNNVYIYTTNVAELNEKVYGCIGSDGVVSRYVFVAGIF